MKRGTILAWSVVANDATCEFAINARQILETLLLPVQENVSERLICSMWVTKLPIPLDSDEYMLFAGSFNGSPPISLHSVENTLCISHNTR